MLIVRRREFIKLLARAAPDAAPSRSSARRQVDCRGGATNEVGPPRADRGALIPYSDGGRFN
jgi:hypothetical protein